MEQHKIYRLNNAMRKIEMTVNEFLDIKSETRDEIMSKIGDILLEYHKCIGENSEEDEYPL